MAWREREHPRVPRGSGERSGRFTDRPAAWADRLLERIAGQTPHRPGAWTPTHEPDGAIRFRNGQHSILVTSPQSLDIPRLGRYLDDLIGRHPAGPARISVEPDRKMVSQQGRPSYGMTVRGEPSIRLSDELFSLPPGGDPRTMPTYDQHSPLEYILAHEWGHALDRRRPDQQQALSAPDMSVKGQDSPSEAYAEAFAEWHLSRGRTTNRAARIYAKEYGWT